MVKNTFLTFIGKYRNQAGADQRQAAEHIENLIRFNNVVVGPLLAAVKVQRLVLFCCQRCETRSALQACMLRLS